MKIKSDVKLFPFTTTKTLLSVMGFHKTLMPYVFWNLITHRCDMRFHYTHLTKTNNLVRGAIKNCKTRKMSQVGLTPPLPKLTVDNVTLWVVFVLHLPLKKFITFMTSLP